MDATIAAISTAMSASGIGIVRISGENAMDVIAKIYRSKNGKKDIRTVVSHTIHYGFIYDGEEVVDEVLELFIELGADDDQLEFPVVYASAINGTFLKL